MAYSKTVIVGRLTKDAELKTITVNGENRSVCNVTIAVQRRFKRDEADFYFVNIWGKQAENFAQFVKKGHEVLVEGTMESRTYTAKTPGGEDYDRQIWELRADNVTFLSNAPSQGGGEKQQAPQQQNQFAQTQQQQPFGQQQQQPFRQQQAPANNPFLNDGMPF